MLKEQISAPPGPDDVPCHSGVMTSYAIWRRNARNLLLQKYSAHAGLVHSARLSRNEDDQRKLELLLADADARRKIFQRDKAIVELLLVELDPILARRDSRYEHRSVEKDFAL